MGTELRGTMQLLYSTAGWDDLAAEDWLAQYFKVSDFEDLDKEPLVIELEDTDWELYFFMYNDQWYMISCSCGEFEAVYQLTATEVKEQVAKFMERI